METILNKVDKEYSLGNTKVKALNGVDLIIKSQDFITVAGPSGSGKTTLLNMLGCLDTPCSGEVLFDGVNSNSLSLSERAHLRNEKVGFIFQSFNLMPVLNVYENIELPAKIGRKKQSDKELQEWIMHLVDSVGLADRVKHRPDELSGGQRQRVAIARALVNKPELVLADEPTANLDSNTGMRILDLMRKLNQEEQTAFVFSTHDPDVIDLCDHVVRMKNGSICN
ncbi:MAG: putative ABC transport system ATP-binding protein [Arenicella sp.]